jgi:hypothetical protein
MSPVVWANFGPVLDPIYDPVRRATRWATLVKRVGLSDIQRVRSNETLPHSFGAALVLKANRVLCFASYIPLLHGDVPAFWSTAVINIARR